MSDLPPNIDAILASIRSRMNEEGVAPIPELPPELPPFPIAPEPAAAPPPVADIGQVVMTPAATGITIDSLMRSMIEPMLQAWLDDNMPEIVEKMAQAEIKRLTGRE